MKIYWDIALSTTQPSGGTVPEITELSIDAFRLTLTSDQAGDIYRVYSSSATKPTKEQVVAGQDHTGASVLSYGPTELVFGETAVLDDDISSLPDGVFYLHAVVQNSAGISDVATLSETKNTNLVVVSGSTGATVTTGVSIDGNTYDIYDFLDDGTLTVDNTGALEARGVARGGNGGDRLGGGGGGGEFGEYREDTTGGIFVSPGVLPIVVGDSSNNGDTTFAGKTLKKGGNGGTLTAGAGQDGGSGGGAGAGSNIFGVSTASDGVGNDGAPDNANANRGGGGGGAESAGTIGGTNLPGIGGDPISSMFTGTEEFFAAGGDAGASGIGADGTANTGDGGEGGDNDTRQGGNGGSGRVTIRIRTA